MLKLSPASYDWALNHLLGEYDTDLFPLPFEIQTIQALWGSLREEFERLDLSNYTWRGGRRFIVPKNLLAFRAATQLDPIDSLVMSALIYEHGAKLEASRIPSSEKRVFSYRLAPSHDGKLYANYSAWHDFWSESKNKASTSSCDFVVIADISDFYNQIYHHVLERHFVTAALDEPVAIVIKKYLQTLTDKVSRGVPVGPHTSHILAECALDSMDRSLLSHGYEFCRYVDDVHIFVKDHTSAVGALYDFAQILDSQQRLIIQKEKTKIVPVADFLKLADAMLIDRPLNAQEAMILNVINRQSGGDPYAQLSLAALKDEDVQKLREDALEGLISIYLSQAEIDYARLAWLLRRLAQVGAPGAVNIVIANLQSLSPILGPVARYLTMAIKNYTGDCIALGEDVVTALDTPIISRSPYLQVVLLDILATVPELNNVDRVTARFNTAEPAVRREIIRVAETGERRDWLRDRKADFRIMDPWTRRAFVRAASVFPPDEARFWIDSVRDSLRPIERAIAKNAIPSAKVGEIRIVME